MANNRRWTQEEDNVLLQAIKNSPENLKHAFSCAAVSLDRTKSACEARWYLKLSKDPNKDKTCFVTVSKRKYGRNRKNVKEEIPEHTSTSFWGRIIKFFFS